MEALVAGSPTIKFVNDVYSMRVLLERLTPTQDQAHTLPRPPPSVRYYWQVSRPTRTWYWSGRRSTGEEEAEEAARNKEPCGML